MVTGREMSMFSKTVSRFRDKCGPQGVAEEVVCPTVEVWVRGLQKNIFYFFTSVSWDSRKALNVPLSEGRGREKRVGRPVPTFPSSHSDKISCNLEYFFSAKHLHPFQASDLSSVS